MNSRAPAFAGPTASRLWIGGGRALGAIGWTQRRRFAKKAETLKC